MPSTEELTTTEAGQRIGRSLAQVARLITLGELRARRDARGWWRVEAESVRQYAERVRQEPEPESA